MADTKIVKQIEDQRWKSNPSARLQHRKKALEKGLDTLVPVVARLEKAFQEAYTQGTPEHLNLFLNDIDSVRASVEPLREQILTYRQEITDLRPSLQGTQGWVFVLEPLFDAFEVMYCHFYFLTCTLDNLRHTAAMVHMRLFAEGKLVELDSEEWWLSFSFMGDDAKWFVSELVKTIEPMDRATAFLLDWWTPEREKRWQAHYKPLSIDQIDKLFSDIADLVFVNGRLYPILSKNFRDFVTLKRQYNYKNKNQTPVRGPGFRAVRQTRKHRKYFTEYAQQKNMLNQILQ